MGIGALAAASLSSCTARSISARAFPRTVCSAPRVSGSPPPRCTRAFPAAAPPVDRGARPRPRRGARALGSGRCRRGGARAHRRPLDRASAPVEASLETKGAPAAGRVARARALAPADPEAARARARLALDRARAGWDSGQTADGRPFVHGPSAGASVVALRRQPSRIRRVALPPRGRPIHTARGARLGAGPGRGDRRRASRPRQAAAFSALSRAIALQPENRISSLPRRPRLTQRDPSADRALLDPERDRARSRLLADLATPPVLRPHRTQWAAAVPDTVADRLELAAPLERAGLGTAAEAQYRRAAERPRLPPGRRAPVASPAPSRVAATPAARSASWMPLSRAMPPIPSSTSRAPRPLPRAATRRGRSTRIARRSPAQRRSRADRTNDAAVLRQGPRSGRSPGRARFRRPRRVRYRRALAEFLNAAEALAAAAREWQAVIAGIPGRPRVSCARDGARRARPVSDATRGVSGAVALDGGAIGPGWRSRGTSGTPSSSTRRSTSGRPCSAPSPATSRRGVGWRPRTRAGRATVALLEYRRVLAIAPDTARRDRPGAPGAPPE